MVPAGGSITVDFVTPSGYMHIDAATVEALELIRPARGDGAPARGAKTKAASLFWWLNRTTTACGAQLLKVCACVCVRVMHAGPALHHGMLKNAEASTHPSMHAVGQ